MRLQNGRYVPVRYIWCTTISKKTKMVVDMELQEAKDAVLQLMKEKDKIEGELRSLKEILDFVRILCMILFPT